MPATSFLATNERVPMITGVMITQVRPLGPSPPPTPVGTSKMKT